jgi:hypothetical protein
MWDVGSDLPLTLLLVPQDPRNDTKPREALVDSLHTRVFIRAM